MAWPASATVNATMPSLCGEAPLRLEFIREREHVLASKWTMGETAMSVIPVDEPPGFWQKVAQTLDAYFADRTKRAVPEITLRRSRHEIARCRRLMHKPIAAPIEASPGSSRVALTRPRS